VAPSLEEGRLRVEEGYGMVAVGFDTVLLIRAVREMMAGLRRPLHEEVYRE
jgi:hypothetical protein